MKSGRIGSDRTAQRRNRPEERWAGLECVGLEWADLLVGWTGLDWAKRACWTELGRSSGLGRCLMAAAELLDVGRAAADHGLGFWADGPG
ncbi:hypothetical protein CDL15_Pgr016816 [Punica granatum]|uniref:Uncharacterized protein n=1 Tax=Punica granatum TaxID=22663 RepID=A0A218WY23_PUNGR|nr:hypothetical protein CDL15_Pgr016816 [Punica granatum]